MKQPFTPNLRALAGFLWHMGCKPTPEHTLDRIDNNDREYAPGKCRWATPEEQANNRSTTSRFQHPITGKLYTAAGVAKLRKTTPGTVRQWKHRGKSIWEIFGLKEPEGYEADPCPAYSDRDKEHKARWDHPHIKTREERNEENSEAGPDLWISRETYEYNFEKNWWPNLKRYVDRKRFETQAEETQELIFKIDPAFVRSLFPEYDITLSEPDPVVPAKPKAHPFSCYKPVIEEDFPDTFSSVAPTQPMAPLKLALTKEYEAMIVEIEKSVHLSLFKKTAREVRCGQNQQEESEPLPEELEERAAYDEEDKAIIDYLDILDDDDEETEEDECSNS